MNHPDPLFTQTPPRLGNQYRDDCLLVSWLHRMLPLTRLRETVIEWIRRSALTSFSRDRRSQVSPTTRRRPRCTTTASTVGDGCRTRREAASISPALPWPTLTRLRRS